MSRVMKDSGVEWIGYIPESWNVKKFKHLIKDTNAGEVIDKNYWNYGDELLYTCQRTPMQSDFDCFPDEKRTVVGDILLTRNATPYVFIPEPNSIYSNVVQRVKLVEGYDIQYVKYSLLLGAEALTVNGNTIPSYNMEVWKGISIPSVDMETQKKIVGWLTTKCSRIDSIIEQTQASIEEYKKLKQSVITQAVTKGIRPGRKMKDSGIEWIGEIPEEWDVVKLKRYSMIRSGITLGKIYPLGTELIELPYLRVANVQGSYTDLSDIATIKVTKEEAEKYSLHSGELLMTEGGDRDKLGRGTVWHGEISPCLHQNHVFALQTDDDSLLADFVSFITDSFVGRDYFDVTANQSVHLASTNSTTIMNFSLPYPPVAEQREIVEYLKNQMNKIDSLIDRKNAFLSELESYKKSLIYEYVTGKKEVPA